MTLKTTTAIHALKAAYSVSGLPAPARNESRLQGFIQTGTPGYRWKLDLIDGDWITKNVELGGDAPIYELSAAVEVFFAMEGEAGDVRDALWDAAIEVIASILPPNSTLAGAVDSLDVSDQIERDHYILENAAPVEAMGWSVDLNVSASSKFG